MTLKSKVVIQKSFVYFPVDGSWPSDESEKIKADAIALYETYCLTRKPVYLIVSSYWNCQGYWIEFAEPKSLLQATVMRKHE